MAELHGRSQTHELAESRSLTAEEKLELKRMRVSELQGRAVYGKNTGGIVSEPAELECLRRLAEERDRSELG
jgi:hypothetical protein